MAAQRDHPGGKEGEHSQLPWPRGLVSLDGVARSTDTCLRRDRSDEPRRRRQQEGRAGHELRSHAGRGAEQADETEEDRGRDDPHATHERQSWGPPRRAERLGTQRGDAHLLVYRRGKKRPAWAARAIRAASALNQARIPTMPSI